MNKSTLNATEARPVSLINQMRAAALRKHGNLGGWARAAGLPKETLSRLQSQQSCDLRTLATLAAAAGYALAVTPVDQVDRHSFPDRLSRPLETRLIDLAASGNTNADDWKQLGSPFFMGGLAVLLAGARGFERERYLRLAEALHQGISSPEVFGQWLRATPLRAARFLPMARKRKSLA